MAESKLKITIDEKLFGASVQKAMQGLESATLSTQEKVRRAADSAKTNKSIAQTTTDPVEERVAKLRSKKANKEAEDQTKFLLKQNDVYQRARELSERKHYTQAKKLLKDFNRETEREQQGLPAHEAAKGGWLYGKRGTAIGKSLESKGITDESVQRAAMRNETLKGAGMHAAQSALGIATGGVGNSVLNNFMNGGIVGGIANSVVDLGSWSVQKGLDVGQQRRNLQKQYAGAWTQLGDKGADRVKRYHTATEIGWDAGLDYEQSAAMGAAAARQGASPGAMKGIGLMQSRLGVGQESIGYVGAMSKFGKHDVQIKDDKGKMVSMGEGEKQTRLLALAVQQGTISGLAKSRLPEFLNAQTAILSSYNLGQKGDELNVMSILTELGKKGFQGDQGVGAYKGMQTIAQGGKTELGRAIALKAAGWGTPGVSYAEATMNMEEAGRTMTPAYFNKLVKEYRRVTGGDEGTARMKIAENMGIGQKATQDLIKQPLDTKTLTNKDVIAAKRVEDNLVEMGDRKSEIDKFQKKAADKFETMFESDAFQESMKKISETVLENGVNLVVDATQAAIDAMVEGTKAVASIFEGVKDLASGKSRNEDIVGQVKEERATAEAARVQAEYVEKQRLIAEKESNTVDEFGRVIQKFNDALDNLVLRGPGDKGPTTKKPAQSGASPPLSL